MKERIRNKIKHYLSKKMLFNGRKTNASILNQEKKKSAFFCEVVSSNRRWSHHTILHIIT
jgi:hypothetical protein